MHNSQDYLNINGVTLITKTNFDKFRNSIKDSIDSFNSHHTWDEMWTLGEAEKRIEKGDKLFLGQDEQGPLAHMWSDKGYLYNVYVSNRRKQGHGVKFVHHCLNYIEYKDITVYCDKWNSRAQKFTEKIGFIKQK